MPILDTLQNFIGKQAFIRLLNESVGMKAFGVGAYFNTGNLGGWVDVNRIQGYTFNEGDGKWYSTPPSPDYGQYGWSGLADPAKQGELSDLREIHDAANKIEQRNPYDDSKDWSKLWQQIKDPATWDYFRNQLRQLLGNREPTDAERQTLELFLNEQIIRTDTTNGPNSEVSKLFRNGLTPTTSQGGGRVSWGCLIDPMAIDLDGDGIETVGTSSNAVAFDHDGDGVRSATGWLGGDDAWLVLDRNGNGSIDSGAELFGVNTQITVGGQTRLARDGFEALRSIDNNVDGIFNSSDAAFSQVRLWRDLNSDAVSQSGELFTLDQQGIVSIELVERGGTVDLGNGNTASYSANVTRTNGSVSQSAVNLNLSSDPFQRQFLDSVPLTAAAQALPDMGGSGLLRDLRESMSLGTPAAQALVAAVQQFSSAITRDAQMALIDTVISAWANTAHTFAAEIDPANIIYDHPDFVWALDPQSALPGDARNLPAQWLSGGLRLGQLFDENRLWNLSDVAMQLGLADGAGGYDWSAINAEQAGAYLTQAGFVRGYAVTYDDSLLHTSSDGFHFWMESAYDAFVEQDPIFARELQSLEAFNGEAAMDRFFAGRRAGFVVPWSQYYTIYVPTDSRGYLNQSYENLRASVYETLALQTRLLPYLDAIKLTIDDNGISFDTTALSTLLGGRRASNERDALLDLLDLNKYALTTLQSTGFDAVSLLAGWIAALPTNSPLLADLASAGVLSSASDLGTDLNDILFGDDVGRTIEAGAGSDVIRAGGGFDLVYGGDGNDALFGEASSDMLFGDAGNDTLDGGAGAYGDTLRGGAGNDELSGQDGSDELYGEDGDDRLYGGVGNDYSIYGGSGDDFLSGGDGDDRLFDGEGNDTLQGGSGDDRLQGGAGNTMLNGGDGIDTLNGGTGSETFEGGLGNDWIDSGGGHDTFIFGRGDGSDVVSVNLNSPDNFGTLQFKAGVLPTDIVSRFGTTLPFTDYNLELAIAGTADKVVFRNFFWNSPVADKPVQRVVFADGTTWNYADIMAQVFKGTGDADIIIGTDAAEAISGQAGDDRIYGQSGNDTLSGGAGNDALNGGTGNNTFLFGRGDGADYIGADVRTMGALNALRLGPGINPSDLTLRRNGVQLVVSINGTTDVMRIGDFFYAKDTPELSSNPIQQFEFEDGTVWNFAQLYDMGNVVESSTSVNLDAETKSLLLIGQGNVDGTGNALNNTLTGNSGANRLNGGAGVDTLAGGAGNDTYVVDNAGDVIIELAGEGTDAVESTISWVLGAEIEKLTLLGTGATNATGNALANTLIGNSGANRLDGGSGADSMTGGAGNDTYVIDNAGDSVVEAASGGTDTVESGITWTLASQLEALTLTGIAAINATGNTLGNTLRGNAGNNVLDGGTGNDTMLGGAGNDTYVVNIATDVVTELANEGIDTVQSAVTFTLGSNVENLTLTGTSSLSATGNTLDNVLTGNSANNTLTGAAGNDTLDGGAGTDTMRGGTGDDTYVVERTADAVTENANEGIDTVRSSVTLTLGSNVENLSLAGSTAINGTGNTSNNVLLGNAGVNVLAGAAGDDTYDGAAGNDTFTDTSTTSNDTYRWGIGSGLDLLTDSGGTLDHVDLFADITKSELKFVKNGNNLELSVTGQTDKLTINSWYTSSANQIEEFRLADGSKVLASEVQGLLSAMAAFTAASAGFEGGRATIQPVRQYTDLLTPSAMM